MASISAPSSLATFPSAHASSSRVPHVTLAPVHGSKGRLAVAAVHGDGIWTYDIKTLRPTTSFTVPPSTNFACAPVSFTGEDEESSSRVTAVGVHAGEGVKAEGKSLWLWKGDEGERQVVPLSHAVQSAHCLHGAWPLVVVGTEGSLTLVDEELKTTDILASRKQRIIGAGVVGSRVVLVEDKGTVVLLSLDTELSKATETATATLGGKDSLNIASVSEDGLITAIDAANHVHWCRITELDTSSAGLTLAHPSAPAAIASLPSTGRPLAIVATPHPSASVALVSPSADVPAVLSTTAVSSGEESKISHIALLSTAPKMILGVVLSHPSAAGRSVIHIADVTIPSQGVGLALLVGSAARTAEVFRLPATTSAADKVVEAVSNALGQNDVDKADKAFTTWVEGEDKAAAPTGRRAVLPEPTVRKLLEAVFTAAVKDGNKVGPYASKIVGALVDRKAVNDSMWPGGVAIAGLLPCEDKRSISRLLRTCPSLPSKTSVTLLAAALEGKLALAATLDDLLAAPSPDPAYRAELRRQLDAAGALRILTQYVTWAEAHVSRGDGLDAWPERSAGTPLPSLGSLVAHTSALLDARLPSLMGMAEAEPLLLRLSEALAPALAAQNDYRKLRAPVDATLRAHKAAAKEEEARNDRRRRAFKAGGKGMRDEAVGQWRVEDFVF